MVYDISITADAHQQCTMTKERERTTNERLSELQSRVTSQEAQLMIIRQEKSRLVAELETERARANILDDGKQR